MMSLPLGIVLTQINATDHQTAEITAFIAVITLAAT